MGFQESSLFYLDPHNVRPAVPFRFPPSTYSDGRLDSWLCRAYSEQQLGTFHCDRVRRMPIKSLDPSMLMGFVCTDEADLENFCARVKALPKALFSIAESPPRWAQDADDELDLAMESFSESSFDAEEESDKAAHISQERERVEEPEVGASEAHEEERSIPASSTIRHENPSRSQVPKPSAIGLGVRFPSMADREDDDDDDEPVLVGRTTGRTSSLRPKFINERVVSSASGTSDATTRPSDATIPVMVSSSSSSSSVRSSVGAKTPLFPATAFSNATTTTAAEIDQDVSFPSSSSAAPSRVTAARPERAEAQEEAEEEEETDSSFILHDDQLGNGDDTSGGEEVGEESFARVELSDVEEAAIAPAAAPAAAKRERGTTAEGEQVTLMSNNSDNHISSNKGSEGGWERIPTRYHMPSRIMLQQPSSSSPLPSPVSSSPLPSPIPAASASATIPTSASASHSAPSRAPPRQEE